MMTTRRTPAEWMGWLVLVVVLTTAPACRKREAAAVASVPTSPGGKLEFKLMSFNVRYENTEDNGKRAWRERVPGIVRMIRDEAPDVLGLQELLHGPASDLRASLPGYQFSGVGRNDGVRAGEYAAVLFRADRFEADAADGGTFWLSDTPDVPGSMTWGNEIPRVAVWLRLIDRVTGRGCYIFNTHWDHRHQGSREHAAVLLAKHIDARRHADEPVVLLGDFNAVPNNPAVAYLTGSNNHLPGVNERWPNALVDTFQHLHGSERNITTLHFWRGTRDGTLKVDHILVSQQARIMAAAIRDRDQPMISDHFPVTAKVVFP